MSEEVVVEPLNHFLLMYPLASRRYEQRVEMLRSRKRTRDLGREPESNCYGWKDEMPFSILTTFDSIICIISLSKSLKNVQYFLKAKSSQLPRVERTDRKLGWVSMRGRHFGRVWITRDLDIISYMYFQSEEEDNIFKWRSFNSNLSRTDRRCPWCLKCSSLANISALSMIPSI